MFELLVLAALAYLAWTKRDAIIELIVGEEKDADAARLRELSMFGLVLPSTDTIYGVARAKKLDRLIELADENDDDSERRARRRAYRAGLGMKVKE